MPPQARPSASSSWPAAPSARCTPTPAAASTRWCSRVSHSAAAVGGRWSSVLCCGWGAEAGQAKGKREAPHSGARPCHRSAQCGACSPLSLPVPFLRLCCDAGPISAGWLVRSGCLAPQGGEGSRGAAACLWARRPVLSALPARNAFHLNSSLRTTPGPRPPSTHSRRSSSRK